MLETFLNDLQEFELNENDEILSIKIED